MLTSQFLSHHHAVSALIPKLGTVWTVVVNSRPGQFTPGNNPVTYPVRCFVDTRNGLQIFGYRKIVFPFRHSNFHSSIIQPTDWSLWAYELS